MDLAFDDMYACRTIVQILPNAGGKRSMQRQPLLVEYKQQANLLLSVHNYTPLMISGNDKNKQITSFSQGKLVLTVRYVNGSINLGGP
jgi:hypothetical protein